jgi:hypothetical protein
MDIIANIESIPFLNYMQEQNNKEKDSENEKQNTIWSKNRPPLSPNRD